MLASEGVGTSQQILETVRSSDGNVELITLSPYNPANLLHNYIRQRIDGAKRGTPETTTFIQQFIAKCGEKYQCSNDDLIKSDVSTQSTIEAVVSLLYAFKAVHSKVCKESFGICSKLSDTPEFYSAMLQSLLSKNEHIDLGEVNVSIEFDELGELDSSRSVPAYTLNTVVRGSDNTWQFTEVGQYAHNGSWSYTNENLIIPLYESRCLSDCEVHYKAIVPYLYRRKRNSRYIIAGTGITSEELNEHDCDETIQQHGFIMMEAFYYTVKQVEDITGVQFSTLYINTCYAKLGTHAIMNDIFRRPDKAFLKDVTGKEWQVKPTDFIVFLSGSSSGVTLVLQAYLNSYNIPHISHYATTVWLSDSMRYPLFLRNVPSDEQQAKAMIQIVKQNGWREIGVITSDGVYGQTGGASVEKFANDNGICISYHNKAMNADDKVRDLVIDIRETSKKRQLPRVIIIFAEYQFISKLLQQLKLHYPNWSEEGKILLGSETWSNQQVVIDKVEDIVYGSLTFSFGGSTYSWKKNERNYFQDYLDTQKPANNKDNHLFLKFWQEYFHCYLPQNSFLTSSVKCDESLSLGYSRVRGKRLNYDESTSKYLVLSGLSVAYSIIEAAYAGKHCHLEEGSLNCSKLFDTEEGREEFFQYLKQTKVPQEVNSTKRTYTPFTKEGEGKANYDVYNIIKITDDKDKVAKYHPTYVINEGELQQIDNPKFYVDGVQSTAYSECNQDCMCLNHINKHGNITPAVHTDMLHTNTSLSLSAATFVVMVLLLIVHVAHIVLQRSRHISLMEKLSYGTMPISMETKQGYPKSPSVFHTLLKEGTDTQSAVNEKVADAALNSRRHPNDQQNDYLSATDLSLPESDYHEFHHGMPFSNFSQPGCSGGVSQEGTHRSLLKAGPLRDSVSDVQTTPDLLECSSFSPSTLTFETARPQNLADDSVYL